MLLITILKLSGLSFCLSKSMAVAQTQELTNIFPIIFLFKSVMIMGPDPIIMLLDLFLVRYSLIFLSVPSAGRHVSFCCTLNTQHCVQYA